MLCLRALKHCVERFASEPVLELASALIKVSVTRIPRQTVSRTPGFIGWHPGLRDWGKRASRVPSPPTVRHPLQPHLPLELPPGDDALYMHKSCLTARTRTPLHHREGQRDDAVDCPCTIRQDTKIGRNNRADRRCTADYS